MCVIFDATNLDYLEAVIARNTRHVGPKLRLDLLRNLLFPIFRAEHHMNAITRVRV